MARSRSRIAVLWLYVALAWGGSFVAIKVGLSSLPPVFFAATRLDIAAIIVLPLAWYLTDDLLPTSRDSLLDVAVSGVFITGITNAFLYMGQQYATSTAGAVLFGMNPILAAAFAWLLLPRERLDAIGGLGLLLGIVGIGIVAGFRPSALVAGEAKQYLLVIGAGGTALGSVLSRRINASLSALPTIGWGLLLGGILLHLGSLVIGEQIPLSGDTWSPALWLAVGYLGVLATGGAYPAYFTVLQEVGAVKTNLVSYAVPIVAAIAGWILFGQPIKLTTSIGFLVIIVGFALVNRETLLGTTKRAISTQSAD